MKKHAISEEELEAGESTETSNTSKKDNPSKKVGKKEKAMKKVKKTKKAVMKRESKSGAYKSVRHMMETYFAKNRELTLDKVLPTIKKEFPNSAFAKNPAVHFAWYKSHIINHREFTVIKAPAWAKGATAKIKTQQKKTA